MVAVVWFRYDLRLTDHGALEAAIKTGQPVLPLYVYDQTCSRTLGGAARWWLHHSLTSLKKSLQGRQADLVLLQGNAFKVFKDLHQHVKFSHLYWHDRYDQNGQQQDQAIQTYFKDQGIVCSSFNGSLLCDSTAFRTKDDKPFSVFSPFWKHHLSKTEIPKPLPCPLTISFDEKLSTLSQNLDDWALLPTKPNWARGFEETWTPGEAGAQALFKTFLEDKISYYKEKRDEPAALAISDLSAPIHWGEISVRQLWHDVRQTALAEKCEKSGETFLKEVGWREFSYYTLFHHPEIIDQALRPEFKDFPWQTNTSYFQTWSRGQTGYPFVDAGMRQLWHTGYMHNRVRLVTASFLVKDLLQPWQDGEEWFWDTLIDADLASNPFNWQWVTGCGTDAAPYFRVFNPILQSKKFDPKGEYIRQWVPELQEVPDEFIHEPWRMTTPPEGYPAPIVDHYKSRTIALQRYRHVAPHTHLPDWAEEQNAE